jgi:hypothetical protein
VRNYCYIYRAPSGGKSFSSLASQADNQTTLKYFSPENNFIFGRELEILQKRYPTPFILYPGREKVIDASTTLQEILEVVINSNTKDRLILFCQEMKNLFISSQTSFGFWVSAKSNQNLFF